MSESVGAAGRGGVKRTRQVSRTLDCTSFKNLENANLARTKPPHQSLVGSQLRPNKNDSQFKYIYTRKYKYMYTYRVSKQQSQLEPTELQDEIKVTCVLREVRLMDDSGR